MEDTAKRAMTPEEAMARATAMTETTKELTQMAIILAGGDVELTVQMLVTAAGGLVYVNPSARARFEKSFEICKRNLDKTIEEIRATSAARLATLKQ